MKYKLLLAAMIVTSLFSEYATAQKKQVVISGTVTSAEGSLPLEGAVIAEKETKNITGTMPDGQFSLSVVADDTIIVRFDGYETKEIKITAETYYQIALKHKSNSGKPATKN
jgi:hypothetical protein